MSARPELPLLPDVERLVANFLRESPRVSALVDERVYTVFPSKAGTDPLLLVQRVGGAPPFSQPLIADAGQLQVDAYGGPKQVASELAATARATLTELEDAVRPEGVVSAVRFGALRWQPDETYSTPRPRFLFDVTLTVRAAVSPAERLTERAPLVPGVALTSS